MRGWVSPRRSDTLPPHALDARLDLHHAVGVLLQHHGGRRRPGLRAGGLMQSTASPCSRPRALPTRVPAGAIPSPALDGGTRMTTRAAQAAGEVLVQRTTTVDQTSGDALWELYRLAFDGLRTR